MSNRGFRNVLRWVHVIGGSVIATFVYSPWGADPTFAALTRFVVIPVLIVTGVVMWQQPRVVKWLTAQGLLTGS